MTNLLLTVLILLWVNLFAPLPQNVLGCAGVEASGILGVPVDWEMVKNIPDNIVDQYFDVGESGQVWILSKGYLLVFDTSIENLTQENAHPCGVYAFLSPEDRELLVEKYAPKENYGSWQEYWLANN